MEKISKRIINELRLLTKKDVDHSPLRKNLTKLPFVTIEGKDAKDFDDAVYAEKDNKGIFSLYVSIADVANYVNTESFIDKEAKKRGTSTYFTNRVLPMLPEQISNELCSLKPNEEKKCLVCKIKLDKGGAPKETVFFEGLIKSRARLTYSKVSERQLIKNGFKIVIYANHLLRAAYPAMEKAALSILKNTKSSKIEKSIISIKKILNIIPNNS